MRSQLARQLQVVTLPSPDPTGSIEKVAFFLPDGTPVDPTAPADFTPPEPEEWIEVGAMQNGWTVGGGGNTPRYRKRWDGEVEFRGSIDPGSAGVVFVLPEDYRPSGDFALRFACGGHDGGMSAVSVDPSTGNVAVANVQSVGNYVNLDVIRYYTD